MLDQTIKIQKSLKETGEAILLKAEQNPECQDLQDQCASIQEKADEAVLSLQQIGDLGDEIAVKAAQVVSGQQELSRKADHFIAKQEELGKKVEQAIAGRQELKNESDQAFALQQELTKKADQAFTVQQDLTKKADQTAAGLHELGKKADQALSGQKQLNDSCAAAQAKLDQISAGQKQCINETEFSKMSRTLFAGFRYWEDNFYNAIKGTDIEERYDRLVRGISYEDRTLVDSIIGRIQHLCEKGDKTCYLPDEAERIYRNRKESLRIVRLNDHCFVYRGYKLLGRDHI